MVSGQEFRGLGNLSWARHLISEMQHLQPDIEEFRV